MSAVLVVGNGESRANFDYTSIPYNSIFGCNAIYRDLRVDHLICCDRRMALEACENIENKNTLIYVRNRNYHYFRKVKKSKNIRELPDIPAAGEMKRDQPDHWGSGPYAVLVAAQTDSDEIILLGFDLYGNDDRINNIYKGTVNYNKTDSQAVDYSYWVHQISQIFFHYPQKKFTVLNKRDWMMPLRWCQDNVRFKNFEELSLDNKYLSSIITQ